MVVKGKVEGSAIPDGSVPRVRQRLLLLASISAGDFLWIHSAPAALRTAPSEATYSHCTLPRNTCAPSPITPTASQSRRHIVRRAGSVNGAAVVFSIAMPAGRPTLLLRSLFGGYLRFRTPFVRAVLSNVLLRRSISCSVLGAFRTVKNQHAAPPTRPSFVRVWRSAQCPSARLLTTSIQHGARLPCVRVIIGLALLHVPHRPSPRFPRLSLTPQRLR
jgi:hypothetical protein